MLTALYVPGDRPDRFAKALASGADEVIVDLEDAVHPDRKAYARHAAAEFVAVAHDVAVQVRVNPPDTPEGSADLDTLTGAAAGPRAGRLPGLSAVRVPKVQGPEEVARLAARLPAGIGVVALIESAVGLERAYAIATAHRAMAGMALGEADLRSELGITDEAGLAYARSRMIVAARAADLPAPAMSVYPDVRDLDGLAVSCRAGRAFGFVGRTAIHPRQLPVIVDAFRPSRRERDRAAELLAALDTAASQGRGTAVLADGRFADQAMMASAHRVLELARRYPPV